jgi:cytochrome b
MLYTNQKVWVQVWDPLVRYDHWALVVAFFIAWISAEEESDGPNQVHVWGGYAVAIIVAVRVVWGLVGTRHARSNDFTYSPAMALRYVADELRGQARRYIGHNPAGAYMIAALLVGLIATAGTGLAAYGDNGKRLLASTHSLLIPAAQAEENEDRSEGGERHRVGAAGLVGDLHGVLANITLGLVVLHILGVGKSNLAHRENLVGAMFSGRKRSGDEA